LLFHGEEATFLFLVEIGKDLLAFFFQLIQAICELCNRKYLEIFLLQRFLAKICLFFLALFTATPITCEV
jgi:hypothetical protein